MNAPKKGFLFEDVNVSSPNKSAFDLSNRNIMSAQFDYLYPIFTHHCLPGESYEMDMSAFFRTTPLTSPAIVDIDAKIYWFWIPYRVIFRQWRRFISNGDGTIPMNSTNANSKYCDMPVVTDFQLTHCGNFSYTSYFRNKHYKDERDASRRITWNRITQEISPYYMQGKPLGEPVVYKRYTNGMGPSSLADYLGLKGGHEPEYQNISNLPTFPSSQWRNSEIRTYSSLPFRAYNKIWYDWFRDETFMADPNNSVPIQFMYNVPSQPNGFFIKSESNHKMKIWDEDTDYYNHGNSAMPFHDDLLNVGLLRKCWSRDYFTTALPTPNRGAEVLLPLGDTAPIERISNTPVHIVKSDGSKSTTPANLRNGGDGNMYLDNGGSGLQASFDLSQSHQVDLRNATSTTLNSLRVANAMQKFLEKLGRSGSRYVEAMAMMFDSDVPDAASNRTTLISTSRIPLQIQTNSSESSVQIGDDVIPQGTQMANGTGSGTSGFKLTTNEHGMIMGLMSIEPSNIYCNFMSRDWYRRQPLDFAQPDFGNLGEQPVFSYEVLPIVQYAETDVDMSEFDSTISKGDTLGMSTFGYQSRYAEYKYRNDEVHGRFVDDFNYWHLGRFPHQVFEASQTDPNNMPFTNSNGFLISNVEDYQSIFNEVVDELGNTADHFLFDFNFHFTGIRPLPLYGTPTL